MAFERPIRELESQLAELEELSKRTNLDISEEVSGLRTRLAEEIASAYADLTPWERVNVARHQDRPTVSDYIERAFDESFELHGDKVFGEDRAIVCSLARIGEQRFLVLGNRKGRTTKERMSYNFGCAHPEGYRKALRKMKLAEKLGLPIVSLINTPGAYPGIGAEERGQATAIAENILAMFSIRTPILVIVVGEGGSGGALGIGIGDRVLMLEYSYYSVISPEGCAAILWKDAERTPDAATALKLTAPDLRELKLIDGVIPEPPGGAHRNPAAALAEMRRAIARELEALQKIPTDELLALRRRKYRRAGEIPGRFPVLD
ncbi:MAG: acetyl-CoA carboxylase carboxyltransferase subunit alpha [Planctomycetes bacterium]|nr:acetyl-CoA carboxylase carboxyltransferase subunit alpha [Planctomycetota bacterium]